MGVAGEAMTAAATTARELVGEAQAKLAAVGVETARLDAELLLAFVLKCSRPHLMLRLDEPVSRRSTDAFDAAVNRREKREPVAYIIGVKGFRHLDLTVDQNVLIPRPETELLVEVVAADRPREVLDVATGSGAVALALADELPGTKLTATDVSPGALALAAENARRLGLAERVSFIRSDLLTEVARAFDAVVANLPYVRSAEIAELQPEIAFEPRAALDGGADGLDLVRALVIQAQERRTVKPGGLIALEIGDDQGSATAAIMTHAGFVDAVIHQDLSGRDRVVAARAPR